LPSSQSTTETAIGSKKKGSKKKGSKKKGSKKKEERRHHPVWKISGQLLIRWIVQSLPQRPLC
jgi:hypothetical protein